MIGVVISGGTCVTLDKFEKFLDDAYVVCCDGGIKNFYNTKLCPDVVVGDFDSIDEEGINFISENEIEIKKYNPVKNFTDTEAGVNLLLDMGFKKIIIIAATGTRLDHTLANIFFLQKLYKKAEAYILDGHNIIQYVEEGEYTFQKDEHKYISVVSISHSMTYSTEGLKYKADKLKITTSEIRGVSNELLNDKAKITVHSGRGFIIRSND